jgi:hypothetical protein
MVPKHLGHIDGSLVPHNLISVQESPIPLPRFHMAPRLKVLIMSSGSKKGTQLYFPFLSECSGKQIRSRFPRGVPMERDTHLQGIFTYLLIFLFISKALRKEQDIYYVFKTCSIISILFSTKCRLFHNFIIFCSNNTHIFYKPCAEI